MFRYTKRYTYIKRHTAVASFLVALTVLLLASSTTYGQTSLPFTSQSAKQPTAHDSLQTRIHHPAGNLNSRQQPLDGQSSLPSVAPIRFGPNGVNPESPFNSQDPGSGIQTEDLMDFMNGGPEKWTSPKKLSTSIQIMVLLTVLTLAPSILLMTTCFVRVIVVLGLLRQAIGAQQLPPSQVITALSIFMTILIMAPVWEEIKNDAIIPYTSQEGNSIGLEETINRGVRPLKRFMSHQIEMGRNVGDIWLFFRHLPEEEQKKIPETFNDVPFKVLLPAYMISELKIAFLLGFQIYLPFLVIDIVVSSIAISMGMMMLPPVIISLPFKLILFVLVDGWHLVVGMLLASFAAYS